jgi:hypothetical protein
MMALFLLFGLAALQGPPAMAYARLKPYAPEHASLPPPAGSGVLIVSTGAPKGCTSFATDLVFAEFGAQMHRKDVGGSWVDNGFAKSDFEGQKGTLSVFILPEGEYQAYPVPVNPTFVAARMPRAKVTVRAGEAVYVGEFFLREACKWGSYEVRDREARDLAQLRVRRPEFSGMVIVKRLMTFDAGVVVNPVVPQ